MGDVAKAAGVSTAPVSMALNRKPGSRIPTSTIDKVKAAAQELGYRPNSAARALKTGKTGVLGFISDEVTITRFASPMISGILEYAPAGRHVSHDGGDGPQGRPAGGGD